MDAWQLIGNTLKNWYGSKFHDSSSSPQSNDNVETEEKVKTIHEGVALHRTSWLFRCVCRVHSPVMVIVSVTSLTGLVSYRFYNQPELAVGTLSPSTIIAPASVTLEDLETTEEIRRKIKNGSLPVLTKDSTVTSRLSIDLNSELNQINTLALQKKQLSFVSANIIDPLSQLELYSLSESQWQQILLQLTNTSPLALDNEGLKQLNNYKQKVNRQIFEALIKNLQTNKEKYQIIQAQINTLPITQLSDRDKNILLTLDDKTWENMKRIMLNIHRLMLTQGIPPGLPEDVKRQTVEAHLQNQLPPHLIPIASKLLLPHLKANLIIDQERTIARAEKAALEIETVMVSIEKDQIIINAGEKITQGDFLLLDYFGLSRRSINFNGIVGSTVFVSASLLAFMTIARKTKKHLRRRDHILLWLFSVSIPGMSMVDIGYNPIPAVGFLTSTFYGPTLAISHITLTTALTMFQTEAVGWRYLIPSFLGGVLASSVASRLRSREELALLGVGVGFTQGSAYFVIHLIGSVAAEAVWYTFLPGALWHGTVGVVYTILALGISPYLERFFDLITPIRLAELSNPNRPLLKKLATEAPGTFQHTMFVASLAEAAARKLHCNVELVRAGTLYHDIGKMHDPLGFIENQMGGANKHDTINNPWVSAEIIKKHVSEGIIMAKKYGLPKAITDFIPEHQGTLLISYFYFQAQNQQKENPAIVIHDSDFRYDGPIPQNRETAIVMLADGCEAALRSLKNATTEQAIAMIQKIFKARWRDEQLTDSGLKYDELPIIAEVFVEVWQQSNHQRITYPKGALELKIKN